MVGLASIALSTSSVRAEETSDQSSYPLKSENAIPLGDFSEYFSCAPTTAAPSTASIAAAVKIEGLPLRFMADPLNCRRLARDHHHTIAVPSKICQIFDAPEHYLLGNFVNTNARIFT